MNRKTLLIPLALIVAAGAATMDSALWRSRYASCLSSACRVARAAAMSSGRLPRSSCRSASRVVFASVSAASYCCWAVTPFSRRPFWRSRSRSAFSAEARALPISSTRGPRRALVRFACACSIFDRCW